MIMMEQHDKLKLLGDQARFKILQFLADPVQSCCRRVEGVCACDIEEFLGLSQPTVSHHMKQLVEGGLVTAARRGRWVYYQLEPAPLRELAAALESLAVAGEMRVAPVAPATAPALAPTGPG